MTFTEIVDLILFVLFVWNMNYVLVSLFLVFVGLSEPYGSVGGCFVC